MYNRFVQWLGDLGPRAGEAQPEYDARMFRRAVKTLLLFIVVLVIIGALE